MGRHDSSRKRVFFRLIPKWMEPCARVIVKQSDKTGDDYHAADGQLQILRQGKHDAEFGEAEDTLGNH